MLVVLTLLFVLSGAAGLFYESVWSRYLGLFVGHNAYAQVIVLVIFLGGMAIGAMLVGRISERLKEPLFGYAMVEALVGLIGLVFHDGYIAVTNWAYSSVFPHTAGSVTLTIAKWGLASALILPQSILLGATFPLMTAGALRRIRSDPGRTLAVLYFANSFGAAVGVLVAGFYLVATVGLPGTILAAVIFNFVVAIGSMIVMKMGVEKTERAETAEKAEGKASRIAPSSPTSRPSPSSLLLTVSFGTAIASFIYEIAWIRMLSLVLSSATHAFELMLSAFILGIALGSFWVKSRADRFVDPLRTLGLVQCAMGFLALATLPIYLGSFQWGVTLVQTFARSEAGYTGYTMARYGICLLVMLPATFCAGITLPLITRTLVVGGLGERAIGAVYAWNTFGSIVGVALAALVLMPLIGLKALLVTGAMVDMGIGVWIIFRSTGVGHRRLGLQALAGMAVVAAVAVFSRPFDRSLLVSGVYRFGTIPPAGSRDLLFYHDGRTATISAQLTKANDERFISTNGKSDGSLPPYWFEPCTSAPGVHPLRGDAATYTLAALITLAHAPDAEEGAVIGQGTGMSSHLLLGSPHLKHLATIEIEPEMIAASKTAFYPANRRGFDDPRAQFIIDDAKSYFAAAGRKYDLIFSEPSHPWVSGVSGLFTAEFYQRVSQYLKPKGVFSQWVHIYDINDRLVMTVLAALHGTFRNYEVFMPAASDMLIVATNADTMPTPDWSIFQYPEIAHDLCHQIPFTPEEMEITRLGNKASFGPLLQGAGAYYNSDFFPRLDIGAEHARFLGSQASGIFGLSAEHFDVMAPFLHRRIGPGHMLHAAAPDIPRMYDLALGAALRDSSSYVLTDTIPDDDRKSNALYRYRVWQSELAAGRTPGNWRVWTQRMADVDHDLNGGTAGYADSAFYRSIYQFLDRARAPADVRNVIEFREGIAGWNFAQAAKAGDPLVAAALDHRSWLSPDELRDGIVVARLRLGDATGARRAFDALAPLSRRQPSEFRSALLDSYIQAAGGTENGER